MLWYDSILYPQDTFNAEKDRASFRDALWHVVLAGLIYGGITGFVYEIFSSLKGYLIVEFIRRFSGGYFLFFNILLSPLIMVSILLLVSALLFVSSRFFNGYGDFLTQTYLISLPMSFLIVFSVFVIIPVIGELMVLLLTIYALRTLLVALRMTHRYELKQAAITLVLSLLLFVFISLVLLFFLWQFGIFVFFGFETTAQGFENIKIPASDISYHESSLEFSLVNSLGTGVIITDMYSNGDCRNGTIDMNKITASIEPFVILESGQTIEVKIYNCSRKYLPRGKFYVPLRFSYQEKVIGQGVSHLETGVIEGLTE